MRSRKPSLEPPQLHSPRPYHILFGTGSLTNTNSGPFHSLKGTTQALHAAGHNVRVLGTRRHDQKAVVPDDWPGTVAHRTQGPARLHWTPNLAKSLAQLQPPDVLALESLWLANNATLAHWARRHGVPYTITPHGNLNDVALKISGWKKRIAERTFVGRMLKETTCFHALSRQEANALERGGMAKPIFLIPNGTNVLPPGIKARAPLAHAEHLDGRRILLFLGRIHPIKGLERLLDAWARLPQHHDEWVLVLAGPDDGAKANLVKQISTLGLNDSVKLVGAVHGSEKRDWFLSADAFVLPSFSEGQPVAALEALGHGLPTLVTEECNLPEVKEVGAGYQVPGTNHGIETGLARIMESSPTRLAAMGDNGRELAHERFSWTSIARRLTHMYAWMRDEADAGPDCVNPGALSR